MASRGSGGSRYPSAYGHTPSYRSYNAIPASTGLVVESLASEELDFEIDVFAVES